MSGRVRKKLKGWNANRKVEASAAKAVLLQQIKDLDEKADSRGLDDEEWAFRYHLEDQILAIFRDEEEYWRQRGKSDGYCRETPTRRTFMLLPMVGAGSAAFCV
jgi:hypothetical protein